VSQLERGHGANAPLETWVKLGIALGRPLAASFSRDIDPAAADPRDAGHLAAQELVLRLARGHGRRASVELATRPRDPAHAADVVLRDDRARALILVEIFNRLDDLGAAVRSTDRKAAELHGAATLAGGNEGAYAVVAGWLLVESAANRRLVARFPEFLRARFAGSSSAWARALATGSAPPPPATSALAWIDTRSARIHPLRWHA
jgi:hypothetical protein